MKQVRWTVVAVLGLVALANQSDGAFVRPAAPAAEKASALSKKDSVQPSLWSDGKGTVYFLWSTLLDKFTQDVVFNRSDDGGLRWDVVEQVVDRDRPTDGRSASPELAFGAEGRLYAVWRTKYTNGRKEVRFSASADRGTTWPEKTTKISVVDEAFEPRITVDGQGGVYVVWFDERGNKIKNARVRPLAVYFTRSLDGGKTWPKPEIRLSDPTGTAGAYISARPQIVATQAGHLFVTWYDTRNRRGDLYYTVSTDRGATWGPETLLKRGGTRGEASNFQLLKGPNDSIYLLWEDTRERERAQVRERTQIRTSRSADGGKSWDIEDLRVDHGKAMAMFPRMTFGGPGRVYLVWQDNRNGENDIYFSRSDDGGKTWAEELPLDRDNRGVSSSTLPDVAADQEGRVVAAWADDREGFFRVYVNASADGGKTWLTKDVLVAADGIKTEELDHQSPRVVLDGKGHALVAWQIVRPGTKRSDVTVKRLSLSQLLASTP